MTKRTDIWTVKNTGTALSLAFQIALGQQGIHFTDNGNLEGSYPDNRLPWCQCLTTDTPHVYRLQTTEGYIGRAYVYSETSITFFGVSKIEITHMGKKKLKRPIVVQFEKFEGTEFHLTGLHSEEMHRMRLFDAGRVVHCARNVASDPADILSQVTRCPETAYDSANEWFTFTFQLNTWKRFELILWYAPANTRGFFMAALNSEGDETRTFLINPDKNWFEVK